MTDSLFKNEILSDYIVQESRDTCSFRLLQDLLGNGTISVWTYLKFIYFMPDINPFK